MDIVERWLPVVGYEGHYSVSDRGRVRSEERFTVTKRGVQRFIRERILRPAPGARGHLGVVLYLSESKGLKYVHHLVMEAFVGPRPEGFDIRHLNGNPSDNRLSNLRYGTRRENVLDTVHHGMHHYARRDHCKHGHAYTPENTYIRRSGARACRTCQAAALRKHRRLAKSFQPPGPRP